MGDQQPPIAAPAAGGPSPEALPVAQAETPAIDVVDLSYAYKNHRALNNVTFRVAQQSIHGFVGPNGAGKTTTLKILATLLRDASGIVRVLDHDVVRAFRKVRENIGFMPDHFSMYRQMTVFEYLDFFAAAYGMRLAQRNAVIDDILKLTDMDGRRNDLIRSLSRGMQQRVSLARVLVHDPKVLLLDEPASGLDPRARIELMEIIRELRRMGKTIFISSHILSELAMLCDSFTIIDRGVVKYTGPKEGLLVANGARRSYLFSLTRPHPPTEEALRGLDGVAEVVRLERDGAYRVAGDPAKITPNVLLRVILESQGEIASFQEDHGQLSQAFMDLTEPGVAP